MYCFHILVILFFINVINIFAMEESVEEEKLIPSSTRVFDFSKTAGSFIFIAPGLHKKESLLRSSNQVLDFITLVLRMRLVGHKDKMTQFNLLKELRADFLKFSTLENDEGECLDPLKADEIKNLVHAKGAQAYFERAVCCKIVAEKKYSDYQRECQKEQVKRQNERKESNIEMENVRKRKNKKKSKKRQKILNRALKYANQANDDFNMAHTIDNSEYKNISEFIDEVSKFIAEIKQTVINSNEYRLSLNLAKKAELVKREARGHIVSARSMRESLTEIPEEKEVNLLALSARGRNKTLESIRKKLKPKKRNSLEKESTLNQEEKIVDAESIKKKSVNEYMIGENRYLEAIEIYFEAFKIFKEKIILDQIEKMLDLIAVSERERIQMARGSFIFRLERTEFKKRLNKCRLQLQRETDETNSSCSE